MRGWAALGFAVLLPFGGFLAFSQDIEATPSAECVRARPSPILLPSSRLVQDHRFEESSPQEAQESATVGGQVVRISHSGCAHYNLLYALSVPKREGADALTWVSEAARLMRALAPSESVQHALRIAKSLDAQLASGSYQLGAPIPITDGYEYTSVTVSFAGDQALIAVAFEVLL